MGKAKFTRRDILKRTGIGSLAVLGTGMLPAGTLAAVDKADPMKITKVESITFSDRIDVGGGGGGSGRAEFNWVRLHTDAGITGIGETYPTTNAEAGILKDWANRFLIGKDPRDVEGIWKAIYQYMAQRNQGGADMHMLSAINMAQLDILGKVYEAPLYRLLGGKTRPQVLVYETVTDYWAINEMKMGPDTDKIVRFLMDRSIMGMKIYPLNPFSSTNHGQFISSGDLDKSLVWLRQIREAAGDKMEILVDGSGRWDYTSAKRILKAYEPFNVIHFEDIILNSNAQTYAALARETSIPIAHSENMATRYELREFLESKALDVLMFDLCWCGGIMEGSKMCNMADSYFVPASPHTAGGPLLWLASIHLMTAVQNFCYMESNYWKYTHQYPYFLNNVPVPVDGFVRAPEAPGLGAEIRPELFRNGDAIVETVAQAR